MQQAQQSFQLNDLTGHDIEAIMTGLNELPSKQSRVVMNKLESQIIQQVQAQNATQQALHNPVSKDKEVKTAKADRQPE